MYNRDSNKIFSYIQVPWEIISLSLGLFLRQTWKASNHLKINSTKLYPYVRLETLSVHKTNCRLWETRSTRLTTNTNQLYHKKAWTPMGMWLSNRSCLNHKLFIVQIKYMLRALTTKTTDIVNLINIVINKFIRCNLNGKLF